MKMLKCVAAALTLAAVSGVGHETAAQAQYYGRQYYGGWNYYPSRSYYYTYYYYKPYPSYPSYNYHYAIYYPSYPRYVYYYNPHSGHYWGRYDLQAKGDKKYSLLAEKDRKKNLNDIPEKAFPEPGKMPGIPGAEDAVQLAEPPAPPKDARGGKGDTGGAGGLPGR